MQIHTIGIDLGKTVFHVVGLNLRGEVVVRRKCSRTQLMSLRSLWQTKWPGSPGWFWREERLIDPPCLRNRNQTYIACR